jgi:hypothetical protein
MFANFLSTLLSRFISVFGCKQRQAWQHREITDETQLQRIQIHQRHFARLGHTGRPFKSDCSN